MPSQKELQKHFTYDADTGHLLQPYCWVCGAKNARAISQHCEGYFTTYYQGKSHLMHRLVWIYHNGPIPAGMIVDHINHDRSDSRIENLRLVTRAENNRNLPLRKTNELGHPGITKRTSQKTKETRYEVRFVFNRKNTYVGSFPTFEEAVHCRKKLEIENGFHPNHGKILKDQQ